VEPETRNQKPGTRNQEPETRNQKPGTRNQEPETRNQKPETRNQKPETRNQKPGTPPERQNCSVGRGYSVHFFVTAFTKVSAIEENYEMQSWVLGSWSTTSLHFQLRATKSANTKRRNPITTLKELNNYSPGRSPGKEYPNTTGLPGNSSGNHSMDRKSPGIISSRRL